MCISIQNCILQNSGLSSQPVEFRKPDVTYTYSTKVGSLSPSSGFTAYNNRPTHTVTHTVPSTSSSSSTYSHSPKQTITKSVPNYSTNSYVTRPDQTVKKVSGYIPSSSSTTYTSRPSTGIHIKDSVLTTSKVSSTVPGTNTFSNIPVQTSTKGSYSILSLSSSKSSGNKPVETVSKVYSTVSSITSPKDDESAYSIKHTEDVMDILPVKISSPTYIETQEESLNEKTPIEENIDEKFEEDSKQEIVDIKESKMVLEQDDKDILIAEDVSIAEDVLIAENISIADPNDDTGLLETNNGVKKDFGTVLLPEV